MATRKSGPVKPPTLDLEASKKSQTTASASPRTRGKKPDAETTSAPKSSTFKLPKLNWTLPVAASGGAIAGALLAYLIAATGLWPSQPIPVDNSGPAIAALEQRLNTLEGNFNATSDNIAELNQKISDALAPLNAQLASTSQSVDGLKSQIANLPTPAADNSAALTELQSRQQDLQSVLQTLNTRIDALATGADPAAAEEIADTLAATTQTLVTLRQSITALEKNTAEQLIALTNRLDTTESQIASRLDANEARLNTQAALGTETSQTMRLPLALSSMEAALNGGRPFAAELSALMATYPNVPVSTGVQQTATTGLPTPETIARDFANAIPAMLAAAPKNPDASWQDNLLDQAKSLLALRPTGAVTGNSPEALIARTEAALAIPDFAVAQNNLTSMPEPMRNAAGELTNTITTQAQAHRFLIELRAAALAEDNAQ